MNSTRPVVFIVVGTLAFVLVAYAASLCVAVFWNVSPDPKVLEYLKDLGIFAAGALSSVLAQTRGTNTSEAPTPVEMVNTAQNPANVTEVPKPTEPKPEPLTDP